jgi:hypothetical protein
MSLRTIITCDRCGRDIAGGESHYMLELLPGELAQCPAQQLDLCGFCASIVREVLAPETVRAAKDGTPLVVCG